MRTKTVFTLVCIQIATLAQLFSLPDRIDFGACSTIEDKYYPVNWKPQEWQSCIGFNSFNVAPELLTFFAYMKKMYHLDLAIETGTFEGDTTSGLALLFNEVHTAEIVEKSYEQAKLKFSNDPTIHCHLGSSEKVLEQILPNLVSKRILFYLDAHWEDDWPLRDEILEISKTHKDNCIIVIDDFKVPDRPDIFYDFYGSAECSYDYVKDRLDMVFTEYSHHYLIPKSPLSRAKLVVIPKTWR